MLNPGMIEEMKKPQVLGLPEKPIKTEEQKGQGPKGVSLRVSSKKLNSGSIVDSHFKTIDTGAILVKNKG